MNQFAATVTKIEGIENLHFITLKAAEETLTMLSLELPQFLEIGSSVVIAVKPSNIVIAKGLQGDISVSNIFPATISSIDEGKLVAMVESTFYGISLQSLLSVNSLKRLHLQKGDEVMLLIQASALSIIEVTHV